MSKNYNKKLNFKFRLNFSMGGNVCSTTTTSQSQLHNFDPLEFQYGQDFKEGKIQHNQKLSSVLSPEIQDILSETAQKLKISQALYKDPIMSSEKLILKPTSKENSQLKQIQAAFLRPYRFLNDISKGQSYKIINPQESEPDMIIVNDEVMQYFGVFLCFLAQNPKIIQELIVTQVNNYGVHVVRMNIQGKERYIFVDDNILCSNNRPLFSQPVKNIYLWPNILEKAWFKTHGFTQKIIEKTTPQQVFQTFLGHPYKKIGLQNQQQYAKKNLLRHYLHKINKEYGYVLTTKRDPKIHIGISGRKFLYLLGTFQFQQNRYYYIRNPCGKFSFRGTYDQVPEAVQKKLKQEFNVLAIQEGNFLLDENEFLEQISSFAVCFYSKNAKVTNYSLQLQNNDQIFIQTELKTAGNLSLCYRQQSNRKADNKYSPITYQIFNLTKNQLVNDQQNQQGCFGVHNAYLFNEVVKNLPQSKYLIRIKKKDRKKYYTGIQSSLIATFPYELKFDIKNQHQFEDYFKEALKKEGSKILKKNTSNKKTSLNPIDHVVFKAGDLIVIYIEYANQKEQQFKIEVSFPELKNLELIYPDINLKETSLLKNTLSPSHPQELIIFQKIDLVGETELGAYQLEAF